MNNKKNIYTYTSIKSINLNNKHYKNGKNTLIHAEAVVTENCGRLLGCTFVISISDIKEHAGQISLTLSITFCSLLIPLCSWFSS
jgi:hypothetical protein